MDIQTRVLTNTAIAYTDYLLELVGIDATASAYMVTYPTMRGDVTVEHATLDAAITEAGDAYAALVVVGMDAHRHGITITPVTAPATEVLVSIDVPNAATGATDEDEGDN